MCDFHFWREKCVPASTNAFEDGYEPGVKAELAIVLRRSFSIAPDHTTHHMVA